jgi:hypothetical protein
VVRRSARADPARYLELRLIGLDDLITTQRVQTATTAVTVLADIYTFKQSIAATRFMRTRSWRCTRTSSGRNGPLLGKQVFGVVNGPGEPHDHGSATSDLGSLVRLHHR